jgi:hypothetical protein
MIEVELNPANLAYIQFVSDKRNELERKHWGARGSHGADNTRYGNRLHYHGACAEASVAKYLNVWWDGDIGNYAAADVGRLQVRSTPKSWGDLLIRPKDNGDHLFILVRLDELPVCKLVGWIYGRDAKQQRFWKDLRNNRPPVYLVPPGELNCMTEFPKEEFLREYYHVKLYKEVFTEVRRRATEKVNTEQRKNNKPTVTQLDLIDLPF